MHKIVPSMTYNVFGGTSKPYSTIPLTVDFTLCWIDDFTLCACSSTSFTDDFMAGLMTSHCVLVVLLT